MNQIKHILFVHIWPWIVHAAHDAKAWMVFIFGTLCTTGGQFLAGLDFEAIQHWTLRQWALRALVTFAPPFITAMNTGKPHQSGEDIAAKLAALSPTQRSALLLGTDSPRSTSATPTAAL